MKRIRANAQAVAKELIDFDHKLSRMFSARPTGSMTAGHEQIHPLEFQEYFVRAARFTAGTETRYRLSLLVGDSKHQALAKGFPIGMRFHSTRVMRLADAKPMHLGHTVRADGCWRLFAFADSHAPGDASSQLRSLYGFLQESNDSPVRRYTPALDDVDSVIEVIAICQQDYADLSLEALPALLLPRNGRYGLVDYEKAFRPD